jgi:hypothetical protein
MQPQPPEATPPAAPTMPAPPPQWQYPTGPPPALGYPGVPATGYHVPTAPARAKSLRGPAAVVVMSFVFAIVVNAIDTVATPLILIGTERDTAGMVAMLALLEALLILVSFLFTAVAFIVWLYRARANVERWGVGGLGWGPGWAIGGWFIPFANLVIPKLVVDAVYSGSDLPADVNYTVRRSTGLINAWWLTFVFAGIAANVYARTDTSDMPVMGVAGFNGFNTALYIISAVLGIMVVRRIGAHQEARQAALDSRW